MKPAPASGSRPTARRRLLGGGLLTWLVARLPGTPAAARRGAAGRPVRLVERDGWILDRTDR